MKNQYSIHELMTLFADGELSESEEQFLFDAIALHPELQSEFKQTLLVHKLLHEMSMPIPSEECDAQLFARAGFGEKKKKRGLIFFLNRRNAYISAAAVVLCVIGAYSWYRPSSDSTNPVPQMKTATINRQVQQQSDYGVNREKGTSLSSQSISVQSEQSHTSRATRVMQNAMTTKRNDEAIATIAIAAEDGTNTRESKEKKADANPQNAVPVPFDILSQKYSSSQASSSVNANTLPQQHGLVLSRNFSSKYFVEARGAMSMNATTPNISVAGMMKLHDKTWIGLAAGRDNMVTTGNNVSAAQDDLFGATANKGAIQETEIPTESIPTIQHWVGAVVEHRLGTITDGIEPTTRVTLGGAESGPFGKIGVGVMMRFTPQFIGTIGIENTGLVYKSTIDNSWKSVVTFGGLCSFAIEF